MVPTQAVLATAEIITFEPDRQIAWTLHGQLDLGHVYGCRLQPVEEGTLVTSYPDWLAPSSPGRTPPSSR